MSQHVTGFPWKYLKIFHFGIAWHVTALHLKHFLVGMDCHGLSREVTGCHVTSKGKWGVANQQTSFQIVPNHSGPFQTVSTVHHRDRPSP